MSKDFDAYHVWLSIPPSEQPANHYRLLALALFESDPDVIEMPAARQMAHVRTCALGPQTEISQQILSELALAKLCLLRSDRKRAYDAQLRLLLDDLGKVVHDVIPVSPTKPSVGKREATAKETVKAKPASHRPKVARPATQRPERSLPSFGSSKERVADDRSRRRLRRKAPSLPSARYSPYGEENVSKRALLLLGVAAVVVVGGIVFLGLMQNSPPAEDLQRRPESKSSTQSQPNDSIR